MGLLSAVCDRGMLDHNRTTNYENMNCVMHACTHTQALYSSVFRLLASYYNEVLCAVYDICGKYSKSPILCQITFIST